MVPSGLMEQCQAMTRDAANYDVLAGRCPNPVHVAGLCVEHQPKTCAVEGCRRRAEFERDKCEKHNKRRAARAGARVRCGANMMTGGTCKNWRVDGEKACEVHLPRKRREELGLWVDSRGRPLPTRG